MLYNINIQFPTHHFMGQVTLTSESFENGLITTFPAINEWTEERSQSLMNIFAEFYQFGADYFEKGKVSGDDVAAKLRMQLGEIWLGNPKSKTNWHFSGVWPHSVNFGELCFSSDPTVDLEVTWKYKELCIERIKT